MSSSMRTPVKSAHARPGTSAGPSPASPSMSRRQSVVPGAGPSPRPNTTSPRPTSVMSPSHSVRAGTSGDLNATNAFGATTAGNLTTTMSASVMGTSMMAGSMMAGTSSGGGKGGENVRVYVRLRDFSVREKENFIPTDLAVRMSGPTCEVTVPGRGKFPFTFDECFWSNSMEEEGKPYADQDELYNVVGAPLVSNVLQGFNSSIIAYGQTGSGKTYSIFGPSVDEDGTKKGLIPRVCDGIFASLKADKDNGLNLNTKFTVSVTMLEVYLEEVFDLLNKRTKLTVRQDSATSFGVVGARSFEVKSYEEVLKLIEKGDSQKTFAATAMNERSSRAHTLFQLVVSAVSPTSSRSAKVMLADLAGCERIKVSKTETGTARDEACNINLSLLTLGTCIEAVVARSKQGRGIDGMGEFRQSTLTKLLKDFIGGNSRTAMLVAIAPALKDVNLTLQALRFADRAKQITTHAKINSINNKANSAAKAVSDEALKSLYDSKKELLDKEYQLEKAQSDLAARQEEVALAQMRLEEERNMIAERFKHQAEMDEAEKKMYEARIAEIEQTTKNLTQELSDMEAEKERMRQDILKVVQSNAAIVSDKEELERQLMDLRASMLQMETEHEDEMTALQDQKVALEKDVEVLEERLKAREAYHARIAREEKAVTDKAMEDLRAALEKEKADAIAALNEKLTALEGSHAASRKQCFSLTASVEKEKAAYEALKKESADAAAAKETAHARAVEVLQTHFEGEIEALKKQIAQLEAAAKYSNASAEAFIGTAGDALFATIKAKEENLLSNLQSLFAADAAEKKSYVDNLEANNSAAIAALKGTVAALEGTIVAHEETIMQRDAEVGSLKTNVEDLDKCVADWEKRHRSLERDMADYSAAAEAAADAVDADNKAAIDALNAEKAKVVAALEKRIADGEAALKAAEATFEEEKMDAEMKAIDAAEANAKATAELTAQHESDIHALEMSVAEKEAFIADEQKQKAALAQQLDAEQRTVAEKKAAIESLTAELAQKVADNKAECEQHEKDVADLQSQFETQIADMQSAHRKDLATLKTTAITAAQQQHHHAKMLANEAHQAQFMIQQALAKFNSATKNGSVPTLESTFAGIGVTRTSSNVSLTSPNRSGTPPPRRDSVVMSPTHLTGAPDESVSADK